MRRNSSQEIEKTRAWNGECATSQEPQGTQTAHVLATGNVSHAFQNNHLAEQHVKSKTSVMLEMQHLRKIK